jgi:hypothetical protein
VHHVLLLLVVQLLEELHGRLLQLLLLVVVVVLLVMVVVFMHHQRARHLVLRVLLLQEWAACEATHAGGAAALPADAHAAVAPGGRQHACELHRVLFFQGMIVIILLLLLLECAGATEARQGPAADTTALQVLQVGVLLVGYKAKRGLLQVLRLCQLLLLCQLLKKQQLLMLVLLLAAAHVFCCQPHGSRLWVGTQTPRGSSNIDRHAASRQGQSVPVQP